MSHGQSGSLNFRRDLQLKIMVVNVQVDDYPEANLVVQINCPDSVSVPCRIESTLVGMRGGDFDFVSSHTINRI